MLCVVREESSCRCLHPEQKPKSQQKDDPFVHYSTRLSKLTSIKHVVKFTSPNLGKNSNAAEVSRHKQAAPQQPSVSRGQFGGDREDSPYLYCALSKSLNLKHHSYITHLCPHTYRHTHARSSFTLSGLLAFSSATRQDCVTRLPFLLVKSLSRFSQKVGITYFSASLFVHRALFICHMLPLFLSLSLPLLFALHLCHAE